MKLTQFFKPKHFAPGPDILVMYEGFLRIGTEKSIHCG
jgi:hypothetical protein